MFVLGLLVASPSAFACGGFFCNAVEPVVQKAERIVFAVDEVAQVVETHVQVEYEGPADSFAWIVPVQSEPELFLTNEQLFSTVGQQLQPVFQLNWQEEGECDWGDQRFGGGFGDWDAPQAAGDRNDSAGGIPESPPGVEVIATATVGPYATVTLQARELQALMDWLAANDYAIPSSAAGSIAPYISEDGYFVALKLVKGNDAGDLAPLGLRYAGTRPAVPIQLTAVAAADDLRLEVTVFGSRRAVPESYLHVTINDAAIDWFAWGANYDDVITKAADEAGGQAFATDYAGTTEVLFANFAVEVDPATLAAAPTPTAWIETLQSQGFRGTPDMFAFFERWFPVADGLDPVSVYNCPACQGGWYVGPAFDAAAVTADLEVRIVEPRRAIDAMLERYPYVTRLTSSLSASEMTVDPTFVFTDHLGDIEVYRTADLVHECHGRQVGKAPRRLELPDGRVVLLPPQEWFAEQDTTESAYLAELGTVNAAKIERTGVDAPEVLVDYTQQLADQVTRFNQRGEVGGCGCQSAVLPTLPGALFAVLGLVGLRRRR